MKKDKPAQAGQLLRTMLRKDEVKRLSEIARKDGRSRSNFVTLLIRKTLSTPQPSTD